MIHSANPKSRPVWIIVFAHIVRPSHFSNLVKQNNRKRCSLLAWLWDWPSRSLMAPVLSTFIFSKKVQKIFKIFSATFATLILGSQFRWSVKKGDGIFLPVSKKQNKTSVINDPLGQSHSLDNSKLSSLC